MNRLVPLSVVALLGACNLTETATTAAVGAKGKAQEVEQAKATQQRAVAEIETATRQADQRLKDADVK